MKRRQAGPGSITQWIAACQCDELIKSEDDTSQPVLLCNICNKRISEGRVGSLTQWVFRSDLCRCEKPMPTVVEAETSTKKPATIPKSVKQIETEGIAVDQDSFPADRYVAMREIGRGAAGVVYLAHDKMLKKNVAIKCLKSLDWNQLMDFQKEAQATSKLDHPLIIKIFDFGALPSGAPYMVMEHVDGTSLKQFVDSNGPLKERDALPLFADLARAFAYAHKKGVFHRDVKSSNVIVVHQNNFSAPSDTLDFDVRVIDFGVAAFKSAEAESQLASGVTLVGTPPYMAPDQMYGIRYDARSEIYSLGCLFYETLCGSAPFKGDSALETLNMHASRQPEPLGNRRPEGEFSPELEELVMRCLAKRPEERFTSMDDLVQQLENLMGESAVVRFDDDDTAGSAPKNVKVISSNSSFSAILVGLCVLCIGLLTVLFNLLGPRSAKENSRAVAPVEAVKTAKPSNASVLEAVPDWPQSLEPQRFFAPSPERLSITNAEDSALDILEKKPEVRELQLMRCNLTAIGMAKLIPHNLTRLSIDDSHITPDGLTLIGRIKTLKTLLVRKCGEFTGSSFKNSDASLDAVTIYDTSFNDASLAYLAAQKQLRNLAISNCRDFKGNGLGALRSNRLELLELTNTYFQEGRPEDDITATFQTMNVSKPYDLDSFKQVTSMQTLRTLALDCDRMTDAHFDLLVTMNELQFLTLSGKQFIRPSNVAKIAANMPALRHFRVIGRCLERVGLEKICSKKNLARLMLLDSDLTDTDLNTFPKSNVATLTILGENTISDAGLQYFARMPGLTNLRLPRVSLITDRGLDQFRKLKPTCKVNVNR